MSQTTVNSSNFGFLYDSDGSIWLWSNGAVAVLVSKKDNKEGEYGIREV